MKVKALKKLTVNGEDVATGAEFDLRPAAARNAVAAGQVKIVDKIVDESSDVPHGKKK